MQRNGELTLGLYLIQAGYNEGAWRDPSVPADGGVDVNHYAHLAALAEAAAFHFVFIPDSPSVVEQDNANIARVSRNDTFEPITLLSALSSRTRDIGLVATATTTYHQPYHLARMLASLDHLSLGRAAWNIVTSGNKYEAPNFGEEELPDHDTRYTRAKEFVEVVKGLWDTWEDDAFVRDKETGILSTRRSCICSITEGLPFSQRPAEHRTAASRTSRVGSGGRIGVRNTVRCSAGRGSVYR